MVWNRSVSWCWWSLTSKEMKASADALLEAGALWDLSACFLWHRGFLPAKHDLRLQSSPWGEHEGPAACSHKAHRIQVSLAVSGLWNPQASAFLGSTDLLSPCRRAKHSQVSVPQSLQPQALVSRREKCPYGECGTLHQVPWHVPPPRSLSPACKCSWKYQLLCQTWVSWADGVKAC